MQEGVDFLPWHGIVTKSLSGIVAKNHEMANWIQPLTPKKLVRGYTQYFLSGTVLQDQLVCPIILPRILIVFGPLNFTFIPENWQI